VFVQNNSGFDIGLSKTLPNGAEVGAEAIYSRSNMLNGGPIFNTSELRLTLNVPLLRMFTPSDQWSALAAAKIDYRASLLTERHVVTEAVLQTVRAYWALRAAQEQYIFLKRSEQTAISLRKIISSLIKGEERAKAEIYQADAHVAEQATQRAAAEQTLFQARQQLGLAMGLDEEDLKVAPYAGEPFPAARDLDRSRTVQDRLIADSVLLRADYQASLKGEQSARVLLDAARRNLLPPVNFQIRASYFGGDIGSRFENFTNSFSKNETGVSVTGQLSFDWPLENRVARGLLIQSSANYATTGIRTDDLRRNIVSGILLSVDFLVSGGQQLQEATAAADAYAKAVENERLKYTNGESTVVDVITIEDRYIQSLLTAVSANQQVASAYAQLRFESGTMFPENGSRLTLRRDVLVSVPEVPR
jgi:outer membrane protein TolC